MGNRFWASEREREREREREAVDHVAFMGTHYTFQGLTSEWLESVCDVFNADFSIEGFFFPLFFHVW